MEQEVTGTPSRIRIGFEDGSFLKRILNMGRSDAKALSLFLAVVGVKDVVRIRHGEAEMANGEREFGCMGGRREE